MISALGGSNVQIGGPAGAFIVIVYGIVQRYGLTNLLISTALAGVMLFAMGALKMGALVRFLPVSIIIGFTNGIAVMIGLTQLKDLLGLQTGAVPADFFAQIEALLHHARSFNPVALLIGAASLALVVVWPKSYVDDGRHSGWQRRLRHLASRLPGTVIALVAATVATALLKLPVDTIGSRFGGIPHSLPQLSLPPFSWVSAKELLIPSVTLALLGAIESLLCARVADNLIDAPRHDPNQELMAQGVANMVVPFFGGIPATGTIARTVTNVRSGATSPVAGIVHALALLLIVLLAAPLAEHVPLAAMAGILLFVAWNMGEWREFARLKQFNLPYRTVLLGTFFLTVVFDLTVAVEVGLMLACGFFIYRMAKLFRAETQPSADLAAPAGVQVVSLYGSLFFAAVDKVEALGEALSADTRTVVLEMHQLVSMDTSGVDALEQLQRTLSRQGVALRLCAINPQPLDLLHRAGFISHLGAQHVHDDLASALAAAAAAQHVTPPAG